MELMQQVVVHARHGRLPGSGESENRPTVKNRNMTPRIPRLLPVLDLLGGHVVWGVAGQRESYRPLNSPLVAGSGPVVVAGALSALVGHTSLYVADLDAIQHDAPDWETLSRLVAAGFELTVDAGLRETDRAKQLIEVGAAHVVCALETLPGPETLESIVTQVGGERTIFSLDLKGGRVFGGAHAWETDDPVAISQRAASTGLGGMLVLDLAGVGVGQGVPTLDLCRQIRAAHPRLPLITGGGVRHRADVEQLLGAGINSVLVASALHRGTLSQGDIATVASNHASEHHPA